MTLCSLLGAGREIWFIFHPISVGTLSDSAKVQIFCPFSKDLLILDFFLLIQLIISSIMMTLIWWSDMFWYDMIMILIWYAYYVSTQFGLSVRDPYFTSYGGSVTMSVDATNSMTRGWTSDVPARPFCYYYLHAHYYIWGHIICSGAYGCILDLLSVMFVPLFCQWSEYVALYSITSGSWSLHCRYMKAISEGGTLCIRSMWWKYW